MPTAKLGLEFLLSDEGKFLQRQLVLALTEDDRLHTQEVQHLWNLVKDDLQPNRLLDAAIGALKDLSREGIAAILPKAPFLSVFNDTKEVDKK